MDSSKIEASAAEIELDLLIPMIRERLAEGKSVTFTPYGVSMLPMLRPGRDTVTISPITGRLKKYDVPLYRRDCGKYVLHRVIKVEDTYTIVGDNHIWWETDVRDDQMIAVVTSFCRDGKTISVQSLGYKIYCRFWHHTRFVRRCWRGLLRRVRLLTRA